MVKTKKRESTTLSIGDGANDVNMIAAAHVGVGISGLEGQQAARSSDYAIGQFKYLRNLLFVHGREAYRRNSFLISFMFYKNVLFVFPIFMFGFYSAFSATSMYNELLYQCYNIFFTGVPILYFAVYDFEFDKEELLRDHRHYRIGYKSKSHSLSYARCAGRYAVQQERVLVVDLLRDLARRRLLLRLLLRHGGRHILRPRPLHRLCRRVARLLRDSFPSEPEDIVVVKQLLSMDVPIHDRIYTHVYSCFLGLQPLRFLCHPGHLRRI